MESFDSIKCRKFVVTEETKYILKCEKIEERAEALALYLEPLYGFMNWK